MRRNFLLLGTALLLALAAILVFYGPKGEDPPFPWQNFTVLDFSEQDAQLLRVSGALFEAVLGEEGLGMGYESQKQQASRLSRALKETSGHSLLLLPESMILSGEADLYDLLPVAHLGYSAEGAGLVLCLPYGVPDARYAQLCAAFGAALQAEEMRDLYDTLGLRARFDNPDQLFESWLEAA